MSEKTGVSYSAEEVGFTAGAKQALFNAVFVAFQRDPERQFVALQRRLGANDALNEYIQHTGSGLFAVLPGVRPGGYLGQGLFA